MATADLFDDQRPARVDLAPGAAWLRGRAIDDVPALWAGVQEVIAQAPLRHLVTPGGQGMSVAMTNCGPLGWMSDRRGYRYESHDPESGRHWPDMPSALATLARRAAEEAGHADFSPDACLVNRYLPGTRLSLHQDRDEHDYGHPIVSVSLGLPATFLFGGPRRNDKALRVPLEHGDVVVWGGPARLHFHGVMPLAEGVHSLIGAQRINLTFRRAG